MKSFLLKQQLPEFRTALERAEENLETWTKSGASTSAGDSSAAAPTTPVSVSVSSSAAAAAASASASAGSSALPPLPPARAAYACACPHLKEFLPGQLDLDFCQTATRGFVLVNPVHALHLASQLDPSWLGGLKETPILYGEEQERTMVMQTPGLPETYHPFMKKETPLPPHPSLPSTTMSAPPSTKKSVTVPATAPATVPVLEPVKSAPVVPPPVPSSSATTTTTAISEKITSTSTPAAAVSGPTPAISVVPLKPLQVPVTDPKQQQQQQQPVPLASTSTSSLALAVSIPSATLSNSNQQSMMETKSIDIPVPLAATTSSTPVPVLNATVPTTTMSAPIVPAPTTSTVTTAAATGPQPPTHAVVPPTVTTTAPPPTAPPPTAPPPPTASTNLYHSNFELPDVRYWGLHAQEDQIRILRRGLMTKRLPAVKKKTDKSSKKRKTSEGKPVSLMQLSAWKPPPSIKMTADEELAWEDRFRQATIKVELWMEHFRLSRETYWDERRRSRRPAKTRSTFGSLEPEQSNLSCQLCCLPPDRRWRCAQSTSHDLSGDELMQCLECSFVGCAPTAVAPKSSQHILQHLLVSNHKFAVTCGPNATVYCFKCGDFVYHDVFDQEKERLDLVENLPSQAWKNHPVQRSFDALRFVHIQDEGVMWKGMVATYPPLVPPEHVLAARLCRRRQILFEGQVAELPLTASPNAKYFAALSSQNGKWRIRAPVGMYNLGNTCFQSAILQCLINCAPLQKFFLHEIGHHHLSCEAYRKTQTSTGAGGTSSTPASDGTSEASRKKSEEVCLGCEMDKMFLSYFGSTIGVDVTSLMPEETQRGKRGFTLASNEAGSGPAEMRKGEPLVTHGMLTAAWKCGGMDHLAGYEQRDAHEFLHGFLDILGKHTRQYRERMYKKINLCVPANAIVASDKPTEHDTIERLFEGTLRSVLMCQDCGKKRIQSEQFMSLSLPLSKEVQKATNEMPGESNEKLGRVKVSVERCLRHFTIPEMLTDPVDCPSCGKKTPTKKQHVVSKLPRVLCLHLKRFDAAQNKKIEDFVSFPAKGLNMGPHLPHWCEVTRVQSSDDGVSEPFIPEILYDLFGTVNHFGNLQSGHYVTNVKVDGKWFHCNDAHICDAGVGDGEAEVLKSDGAYLLFYIRR